MRSLALISLLWGMLSSAVASSPDCQSVEGLSEQLGSIETAIIDDELTQARQLVTQAIDSLSCIDTLVDAASLAGIWQASAAIEYFGASEAAADRDMARAKAIPGAEFRARLGSDLQSRWDAIEPEAHAGLEVGPFPSGSELHVDGVLRREAFLSLPSGPHVVQILEGDRLLFHRVVHLNKGQRALVDTGLQAEGARGGLSEYVRPVLLWSGVASGALAVGSYGLAIASDRQMYEAKTKDGIELLRDRSLMFQRASWALGVTAVVGIGIHGAF